jgi:hypothetical protein
LLSGFTGKTLVRLTMVSIEKFVKSFETMKVSVARKNQILKDDLAPP